MSAPVVPWGGREKRRVVPVVGVVGVGVGSVSGLMPVVGALPVGRNQTVGGRLVGPRA